MKFFRFCPLQRTFFILAELGSFVKDFFNPFLFTGNAFRCFVDSLLSISDTTLAVNE